MNIVDTIRMARHEHIMRTGKPPNAVYMGRHEQESLQLDLAYSQYFRSNPVNKPAIDNLRIFRVDEPSHLTVCWTAEAER